MFSLKNDRLKLYTYTILFASVLGVSSSAKGDLNDLAGTFSTELEENAALANQETYTQLKTSGCTDSQRNPSASCTGLAFISWQSVRELVHTANELVGSGPIEFSLGTDLQGLGFALRWTAGEEFSTQGNLSNNFVSGQVTSLASRLTAIRFGSTGFSSNAYADNEILVAASALNGMTGGGAGDSVYKWSPWGSFLNYSYLYGSRDPSQREDAYDFDGIEVNGGVDYRLGNGHVLGAMLGYQKQRVDFDSSQSIVDGEVESDGFSTQVFYLIQRGAFYSNIALGVQFVSYEMERQISYPSLNPNVSSTNTTALSDTDASSYSAFWSNGYTFELDTQTALEPYISFDYRSITVDEFSEADVNSLGFNFTVQEQEIDSLETTLGLKLHHVLSSEHGVFVPYIDVQYRRQLEDDDRTINAYYVNASEALSDLDAASFSLPVDTPDSDYQVYTIGLSAVLQGASESIAGAGASGGFSGFLNYKKYVDMDFVSQSQISGGLRYEF